MRNPSLQTEKHIYIIYINVKPHQKCWSESFLIIFKNSPIYEIL